jgi:predicted porin
MKKTLIALAVMGSFSGAAMAQSSVQLYGIIDLGVVHTSNQSLGYSPTGVAKGYTGQSVNKLGTGVQSGSRIGVKGTEDLGGGLSAFFQAETGFCANGGSTAQAGPGGSFCTGGPSSGFMSRTSMVGLKGGFGTIAAGRMYSTSFNNAASVDPFGDGLTGSESNLDVASIDYTRISQMLAYVTPNFGGFTGTVAYAFGAQAGNNSAGRGYALNGVYNNGPLMVGIGYFNHNSIAPTALGTYPIAAASQSTNKISQIYGSYDLGVVKLSGMYQTFKGGMTASAIPNMLMVNTNGNMDNRFWLLGATVPVGPGSILASYSQTKDSNTANSTAKQYAIGYTYSLSKRTNLYTSLNHISNSSNTYFGGGNATDYNTGTLGQSSNGFALGIRHQF